MNAGTASVDAMIMNETTRRIEVAGTHHPEWEEFTPGHVGKGETTLRFGPGQGRRSQREAMTLEQPLLLLRPPELP